MNLRHVKSMAPYFEVHYDLDRGVYVIVEATGTEGRIGSVLTADLDCEYPRHVAKYLARAGIEPWVGFERQRILSEMPPAKRKAALKAWGWKLEKA